MGIKETDCAGAHARAKNSVTGIQHQNKWTLAEGERLKAAVAKYPLGTKVSWVQVAEAVGNRRNNIDCNSCMRITRENEARKTAVWISKELDTTEKVVSKFKKGERIVDRLCQLIPDKSKIHIRAMTNKTSKCQQLKR